ncbi:MAG: T9SS type A sorting domain-containing protein [Chitinophagales bacterium]
MALQYLSMLLILFFNPNTRLETAPLKKGIQIIKGNHPAILKTTNGCSDVSHIVITRGDSSQGINGSVGYFSYSPFTFNDTIIIADTLPEVVIDASFPDVPFQAYLGNNEERYFTVSTKEFIYLYYTVPDGYQGITSVVRYDSFPAPSGHVRAVYNGENQLLVVNKEDSVNYVYAFYSIPELAFTGQIILAITPDLIQLLGSNWYLVVGDSSGTQKMLKLDQSNQQISYNITLPDACEGIREFLSTIGYNYFISTPGDSATNLIQFNTSDTIFNVINLFSHSGLNDVIAYSEFPSTFLLQPSTDTSGVGLNTTLLMVDAVLAIATDTMHINKTIHSLHKNSTYGWGPNVYSVIMSSSDSGSKDQVIYYPPYWLTDLDSAKTNLNPSWYGEDYRCYVSTAQVEEKLAIEVNPNPVTDEILIQVNHLASGKTYKFDITDSGGRILWRKDILTRQEYTVPVQDFPKGILILRVDAGTKVVTKAIIKL